MRVCCFFLVWLFWAIALPAGAAVVDATWNSAADVPVSASSYTATGNTVDFTLNFAPPTGGTLTVVNNTGLPYISGAFDNLTQGQLVELGYNGVIYHFMVDYFGGSGNDLVLRWSDGRVFAWGSNSDDQRGTLYDPFPWAGIYEVPSGILRQHGVRSLATGAVHSLALCWDGTLAAWGDNSGGQLGTHNFQGTRTLTAVEVDATNAGSALFGKRVIAVAAGDEHSMALCSDGAVVTWGGNSAGQLGSTDPIPGVMPRAVSTESGVSALNGKSVVAISAGDSHNLALCSDGTVVAWGGNVYGQLGNLSVNPSSVPVAVNSTSGVSALNGKTVVAIAAGYLHSLALCSDGTVVAWGFNAYGQLGDNSAANRLAPVAVNTTSGVSALEGKTVVAIAAGGYHSMALCSDGTVVTWGYNFFGQLGDIDTDRFRRKLIPANVNTTSGVSALYGKTVTGISAGYSHSVAVCSDGTLTTWGDNSTDQLGTSLNIDGTPYPLKVQTGYSMSIALDEACRRIVTGPCSSHNLLVADSPPGTVITQAATAIYSTYADLNITVTGSHVTPYYEYGLTTEYDKICWPNYGIGTKSRAIILSPSTTYHFRAICGTYKGADLTFTTLSIMQGWRQQYFHDAANAGGGADAADYDNDGIPNLIEWACNLNPASRSALPVTAITNGANFEYTYPRSIAALAAGGTFTVEWSDTLAPGSWSSSGVTETVVGNDGNSLSVKAVIPINGTNAKFVRLSVTGPP
jgi:alpha-tubulin suppressor-like RCC1 family protein